MVPTEATSCPRCKHSNPPGSVRCQQCSAMLSSSDTMETLADAGWSLATPSEAVAGAPAQSLAPGTKLGGRYEIHQLLGQGGMGAVYKAYDTELERMVGLKVIRPELAGNIKVLRRFKQELILARQVTHKNVIRIFDLGSAEGMKFITMEFIDGRDLSSLVEEKRQAPLEAVMIMRQVCRALEAAHGEGVIHRDLKPQNIMVNESGRVWVMDFGLARSMETHGLTQTGSVLGTPAYMSPEQAKGTKLDTRSDLFSFGIIFYEMLTGVLPFEADTILGSLLKRTQEAPKPPRELNPEIPQELNDLVMKCLAIDPANRYQTAGEVLPVLDRMAGDTTVSEYEVAAHAKRLRSWQWLAGGMAGLLVVALLIGLVTRGRTAKTPAGSRKALGVIVADFDNRTGEPIFSGTLEPTFGLALEGATFIATYPRSQMMRVAAQVKPGAAQINAELARLIATREGISVVIEGSINKNGDGYVVGAQAVDAVNGKVLASEQKKAGDKGAVLGATTKLAAGLRTKLGDATPEALQVAAAETFTAASLEAAHSYSVAQDLRYSGKVADSIEQYLKAIELDPNLGSAHANLALAYYSLGQRDKAEEYYQRAMAKIDRMSEREKYRARGAYYLTVKSPDKAIEQFTALLKQYPADAAGLNNLAYAYQLRRDMPRAMAEARRGLEIYPKSLIARNNLAHYALYAGEFTTAEQEARAVAETGYLKSYMALALSLLADGKIQESAETYGRLEKVSPLGASLAAGGLADLALYEGRTADAIALLEKSLPVDLAAKDNTAAARKTIGIALAHLTAGRKPAAVAAADRAVGLSKEESILCLAGLVDVEAGQEAKARAIVAEFEKHFEPEPQSYGKLLDAAAALKRGKAPEAIKLLEEASKLTDSWLGRLLLGRAYLAAGAFTEAHAELDRCLRRRGEATEMFLDELATYHFVPPVYYYLGRAQEGLQSAAAKESYRTYLAIKQKADVDPLVEDAKQRAR